MSERDAEQEPSMEEILASIRRIISEDGDNEVPLGPAIGNPVQRDEAVSVVGEEDNLGPFEGVLELTDEVQDDGSVVNLRTGTKVGDRQLPQFENEGLQKDERRQEVSEREDDPVSISVPEGLSDEGSIERLVSDMPGGESVSTLSGLAAAVDMHRRAADPSIGPKTIEDLVKEVMRPMIREWMDANLPSLVERLVSREIERLTREAEEISQR